MCCEATALKVTFASRGCQRFAFYVSTVAALLGAAVVVSVATFSSNAMSGSSDSTFRSRG
jgi:hypothetical protein